MELFEELIDERLVFDSIIQILRSDIPNVDGYFPIIDWYYNKERTHKNLKIQDFEEKEGIDEVKEMFRERYNEMLPFLEDVIFRDCIKEMTHRNNRKSGVIDLIKMMDSKSSIITDIKIKDSRFIISAKEKLKKIKCTNCENKEDLTIYGTKILTIADAPINNRPVLFMIERQKYKCKECNEIYFTVNEDLLEERSITKRLKDYIIRNSFRITNLELSTFTGLDGNTIRIVIFEHNKGKVGEINFKTPEILGFSLVNDNRVLVSNVRKNTVVDLLENVDDTAEYLDFIRNKDRIKYVVLSSKERLLDIVKKSTPQVNIIAENDIITENPSIKRHLDSIEKLIVLMEINNNGHSFRELKARVLYANDAYDVLKKDWTQKELNYGLSIEILTAQLIDSNNNNKGNKTDGI